MPREKLARWQKIQTANLAQSGRSHLPDADKVFDRAAALPVPHPNDRLPLLFTDAITKDVFFPAEEHEILAAIEASRVPEKNSLTHIHLRKPRASEFRSGRIPLAEYVALGDYAVLIFYPWPRTLLMPLKKKPADNILNRYRRFEPELVSHKGKWHLQWKEDKVADFFLNELLPAELLVHAEFQAKHATRMSQKRIELPVQYANQRFFEENTVIW
jgi:hypothetical protein